jgi:hypothetical protein
VPFLLLALACGHAPPHVAYDPLVPARAVPLLGADSAVAGETRTITLRNAADHALWINEADVVPRGAARLWLSRLPVEVPPDGTFVLEVAASGGGQVVLRTSEGVRLVPIRTVAGAAPALASPSDVDRGAIAEVVQANIRTLGACYQDALAHHRDLRGRVRTRFAIDPAGNVASVALLETTLATGDVESCLDAQLRRLRFAASAHGETVVVAYPFVFAPG